ncbi:proline dehydrogenase family protein [Paenibacillus sp. UNC451MF]|uniref:proline dehydrogenase family protein n=1 Tax=Paenibacillus sp. UNC451MF TaxID=1449063 RepID=UPI000AFBA7AD|nr:proline dehydrogenase family protein [Paenibacillus sp. UNC451MF]
MPMDSWFRLAVLHLAEQERVKSMFRKYGMRMGVQRFVAAESLEGVLKKVKELNGQGLAVTLDYLGESVEDPALADEAANQIMEMLREIHDQQLDAHVSVKLSQLGCGIDPAVSTKHMERIVAAAKYYRNFIRIDMEDSTLTESTLELFEKLVKRFGAKHVGTVLQAYLYRSPDDLIRLEQYAANVRIVKGAYKEAAAVAFPSKIDVDSQYVALVKAHLDGGHYTAIATHDQRIIEKVTAYVEEHRIPRNQFEFQMLFGIATQLQLQLVKRGYRVRIYTPFGKQWYPYFTRRIAERPANLVFVLKGLLRR